MFSTIKESYRFLFLNFPRILWSISGLIFLELSVRWLLIHYHGALWLGTVLPSIDFVIFFTQIFVIIDLTRLVMGDRILPLKSQKVMYFKILGLVLLIAGIVYAMISLLQYWSPDYTFSSLPTAIFQLFVVIFGINVVIAYLNLTIPMVLSGQKFKMIKGRYLDFLLVSVLIYLPFIIVETIALISYFSVAVKVLFFSMPYIFSANYFKIKN